MLVSVLRSCGVDEALIADELRISTTTLYKYFKKELEHGGSRIKAKIGANIVEMALKKDKACMFFYMKTQAGWCERGRSGGDDSAGAPLEVTVKIIGGLPD